MLDSDDTTTVPRSDDEEDQILFLNGSQRRGDFVEIKRLCVTVGRLGTAVTDN